MNFLDLAQQNASAGGSQPSGASPEPVSASPAQGAANPFGISPEELERQKAAQAAAAQVRSDTSARSDAQAAKAPAFPTVSVSSAAESRPKDASQVDKAMADGIYLLTFHGEFDETNVDKEFAKIEKFLGDLPHKLAIFDFRDVQYVNSKTMGYLADWYQRFADVGGELVIAHGGAVLDSLEACGITQLVQVHPDVPQSAQALRAKYPELISEGASSAITPASIPVQASVQPVSSMAAQAPVAEVRIEPSAPSASPVQAPAAVAPSLPSPSDLLAPAKAPEPSPSAFSFGAAAPAPAAESSAAPAPAESCPVKVEHLAPVASPSGIRDSDGATFVFYEKPAPAAPVVAKPAPAKSAAEQIRPKIEEMVSHVESKSLGVTLQNAYEIVAAAGPAPEEKPDQDLLDAAREFEGVIAAKTAAPAKSAAVPAGRTRSRRGLFYAAAAVLAAGAAAAQFASPAGVSDLLSSVKSYLGISEPAPQEAPAALAPSPEKPALAPSRRPRPRRPVTPAPAASGATQAGTASSGASAPAAK